MTKTDLSRFDNSDFNPGSPIGRALWYIALNLLFIHGWFPFMGLKRWVLRLFGATIGKGLIIKPHVNIKYPWNLTIGDHVWLGEDVWIDNLDHVFIGDNACISQGALLLCGNHNYKRPTFDLITGSIRVEEGAWVGARSVVTAGVKVGSHAVLSVASVASSELEPFYIYQGNPAVKIRKREIEER